MHYKLFDLKALRGKITKKRACRGSTAMPSQKGVHTPSIKHQAKDKHKPCNLINSLQQLKDAS